MNAKDLVIACKDIYFARFGSPTGIDWKIHPKNLKNLMESGFSAEMLLARWDYLLGCDDEFLQSFRNLSGFIKMFDKVNTLFNNETPQGSGRPSGSLKSQKARARQFYKKKQEKYDEEILGR